MENKIFQILLVNNTRQLVKELNALELTKDDIVKILSPEFKGDQYKVIYFK